MATNSEIEDVSNVSTKLTDDINSDRTSENQNVIMLTMADSKDLPVDKKKSNVLMRVASFTNKADQPIQMKKALPSKLKIPNLNVNVAALLPGAVRFETPTPKIDIVGCMSNENVDNDIETPKIDGLTSETHNTKILRCPNKTRVSQVANRARPSRWSTNIILKSVATEKESVVGNEKLIEPALEHLKWDSIAEENNWDLKNYLIFFSLTFAVTFAVYKLVPN